jgi:hypothetical protein
MDEEFSLLRPVILFCAAALVLGVVIHACHQASEQRARLEASGLPPGHSAQASSGCSVKPVAACRILRSESLSAGGSEAAHP